MLELTRILVFLLGFWIVAATALSAIKTFVVPRSYNVWLTRMVFRSMYTLFQFRMRKAETYEQRDDMMALFAPLSLLALPAVWVALVILGYMAMYWAVEPAPFYEIFKLSGSSLLTLGFATTEHPMLMFLIFTEAGIGLALIALLIAYLPTMYSAFSRRELSVSLLEVRADVPPSPATMLIRVYTNDAKGILALRELWEQWETWFADIAESHTSLGALVFFRSPRPGISWLTAAGVILDAASLFESTIDKPRDVRARLCIRAGFVALRHICDYFRIPYNREPQSGDPISITREEYDEVYDELKAAGLPVLADRDQAWRDYAGWRVNYDVPLLALAELTMAPYAQWVSDRGLPRRRTRLFRVFNAATEWKTTDEPASKVS